MEDLKNKLIDEIDKNSKICNSILFTDIEVLLFMTKKMKEKDDKLLELIGDEDNLKSKYNNKTGNFSKDDYIKIEENKNKIAKILADMIDLFKEEFGIKQK